jgi:hypothetical protein
VKKKRTTSRKPVQKKLGKRITAIAKVEQQVRTVVERQPLPDDQILEAFDIMGITAKLDSQKKKGLFLAIARAMKLNPILGELHVAEMGGVLVPVTDYKVYVDRAERSQRLEWWDVEESGDIILGSNWKQSTYKCTLLVKRRDWPRVWHYTVRFVEAVGLKEGQPNSMWSKRPFFMTWKCAVAGLRLILREDLGELPYIDAEIDGQASYTEEKPALQEPKEIAAEPPKEVVAEKVYDVGPSAPKEVTTPDEIYALVMQTINQTVKIAGALVPVLDSQAKVAFKKRADAVKTEAPALQKLMNEILDTIEDEKQKKLEAVK